VPELPEVETIRAQLAPHLEGARLAAAEIDDPRWCRPLEPATLITALSGRRLQRLSRRGKYLVWELSGDVHLITHLRMTGTILLDPTTTPPHTRVRLTFTTPRGWHVVLFVDPRRFGTGELALNRQELDAFMAVRLGPEPLGPEFTAELLRASARGRRAPIKAFLLDQRRIAGVGNIYADEALFRAGVHPLRPAGRLTRRQYELLRDAIVDALRAGVQARGATIDDFRHVDGVAGSFQDQFLVHRRAGQPCPTCGAEVVKLVAAGRGTYVCERCQPRPRSSRYAARSSSSRYAARSSSSRYAARSSSSRYAARSSSSRPL
jgi:formamidopyrimidine-DNA glycosylase